MMNPITQTRTSTQKGFTIIEMLVSVLVFSFVMIAVLFLFDKGNWLYLQAESRASMQGNGRIAMEAIERDLRMAGLGVPRGTSLNTETYWIPEIFTAGMSQIGFRGDIDNNNSMLTLNATAGATTIEVEFPSFGCPVASVGDGDIVLVQRGRNWQGLTCSSPENASPGDITVTSLAFACLAAECEVYSPEHVWYRLTPDTNNNGVCDLDTGNVTDNYDNCLVQKCIVRTNSPTTDATNCSWQTIATNVQELIFSYYETSGVAGPTPFTVLPLSTSDATRVQKVRISVVSRDRGMDTADQTEAGNFQNLSFSTDVVVRKKIY